MSDVKIGIQTQSLRLPIRKALVAAAHLGAAGVEIDARNELRPGDVSQTGLREFHKLLGDMNLRVSAVAFPTRRGYEVADDLERRVLATQAAMRFAAELRTDVVVVRVGSVPAEADTVAFGRLVEAMTALGMYGDRVGARLALQTVDVSPADLLRLIQALPERSVGVDLHPTGLVLGGYSPVEAAERLGSHVLHVHACDAVRGSGPRGMAPVELGRGEADFPAILGQLTEFNYRGWVTIERRESPDPMTEIGNAVAYLQSL